MSDNPPAVLIIGARGEFGEFLRSHILPRLGPCTLLTVERDTPRDEYLHKLQGAKHVILATPLAGYAERACELVDDCRNFRRPATLWLIPSVQAGVWQAVTAMLAIIRNEYLAAVFVHPMYGPNGFRADESESRTFRNFLTATVSGDQHKVEDEASRIFQSFDLEFGIGTTRTFDPEAHDRATAYSQGLSYCVAQLMFESPEIDELVFRKMPDLHLSFHANQNLINEFMRRNPHMTGVRSVFGEAWGRTPQSTYQDLLNAFAEADIVLNDGGSSPIPTKWYEKLKAAWIETA